MNDTGRLIADTGIIPKKSKGQNFLIDDRVADRHIGYANIKKEDKVLEVGPGLGILTKRLIEVSDDDAIHTARELASVQGLLVGTSSGANVWAAKKIAEKYGTDKIIATILADRAERYFSTSLI